MLAEACGVAASDARLVVEDVLCRAEAAARLDRDSCEILAASFFEESFSHKLDGASPWMKAITTPVIRNSRLEDLHASGPVDAGSITAITASGLGPLSHLIAARRRRPRPAGPAGDRGRWPAGTRVHGRVSPRCGPVLIGGGGRVDYQLPEALMPGLPEPGDVIDTPPVAQRPGVVRCSHGCSSQRD
jgi:hypothetical protein